MSVVTSMLRLACMLSYRLRGHVITILFVFTASPSPFAINSFFYTDTTVNLVSVSNRSIAIHVANRGITRSSEAFYEELSNSFIPYV